MLILVQNLPVPFDRRVWQEACALRDAGYDVSVICPRTAQHPVAHEVVDGVDVHRYRPVHEAAGLAGYLVEYTVALLAQSVLAWRVALSRRIRVVQACNPPDLLFLVALPLVLLLRARFVFDHHDVSPELLVAKGHGPRSAVVRLAYLLERLTFGTAVVSIATNGSYRHVAVTRGGMAPRDVFVVRSGPNGAFGGAEPDPGRKHGRRHLVGYVGVMGVQEGIDHLLEAARIIVADRGRDVTFALAGSGPETARLRARAEAMGLAGHVRFLGRIPDDELVSLLRTADVCVSPDEVNRMNDISTMNKIVEYMALGRPIVQFELREGRASAGDASLYASPNDPVSFADAICRLLDDAGLRERMGRCGRERFHRDLAWSHQVPQLLAAYDRALAKAPLDVGVRRLSWWRGPRSAPGRVSPAVPAESVPVEPVSAEPVPAESVPAEPAVPEQR
ncbi:MAG: glycosyl transferase [Mycobacterium sp.]|nr:glycosyl transferase [Mycobacterium sp.]